MALLNDYQRKRNFKATPEPKGRKRGAAPRTRSNTPASGRAFVIQKHAASHLHYDFRLELDGTLKSWAIPKGPSLDPKDKRLAMQVEDHPLEYGGFEGTIPAGNYGAGTVIVWDNGEWVPKGDASEAYERGKLEFELRGQKLSGHWVLVRTHGRQKNGWLLMKRRDSAARPAAQFNVIEALPDSVLGGGSGRVWKSKAQSAAPKGKTAGTRGRGRAVTKKKRKLPDGAKRAPLPLTLAPQLATLVDEAPRGGEWLWELKYDGYRILARIDAGEVRLFTRNGNDWTSKLPHIARALTQLPVDQAWLDGEVVMADANGIPDFQALQNAFENSSTGDIVLYLFDVPYLDGYDLRNARLDARRQLLQSLLESVPPPLLFSQSFAESGARLLKSACAMKLEGLIGKLAASPYQSARSRDWIKLKCLQRQEFVIGGFTDSQRPAKDVFGALLLGVHDSKGDLRYAGRVGTGFSETSLRELMAKMKPLVTDKRPFAVFESGRSTRGVHWLKPKLVCEVAFGEWTRAGHIRHASFQGLRSDKPATAISTEVAVKPPVITGAKKSHTLGRQIKVTHGERIIDPSTGFTKQQLVDVYRQLAPLLLQELSDRPVSLVRAPSGIEGPRFFQKHLDTVKVAHVRALARDYFPRHPPLLTVDSELGVISCAQMNVIEFHTWNSSIADGKHPNRMVFDLDPGEGVVWPQMLEAAHLVKVMLDELGLQSFLKTSGGKGLHVVVPLVPEHDWATVKDFAAAIVRHMAKTLPLYFVAKSGPRNRVGRIFIDYLRNGLGATTVSAYSVRARPGLGISIPVAWDELDELTSGAHWHVFNFEQRLAKRYREVWRDYEAAAQSLKQALKRLPAASKSRQRRNT